MNNIVVADFVCPTEHLRTIFNPDAIVWMDTIKEGRFADTNNIFEPPIFSMTINNFADDQQVIDQLVQKLL